jgi:hypothetical protein
MSNFNVNRLRCLSSVNNLGRIWGKFSELTFFKKIANLKIVITNLHLTSNILQCQLLTNPKKGKERNPMALESG